MKNLSILTTALLLFFSCQNSNSTKNQPSASAEKSPVAALKPLVSNFKTDPNDSPEQHLQKLWAVLTRPAEASQTTGLLPLPKPFIVSIGQAREVFYWESYFTMLGLQAAGRRDLVENMVENFAHLIDKYGHVPTANRPEFVGRSQPPMFSLMVKMLAEMPGSALPSDNPKVKYLPQLEREYAFWMDGSEKLHEDFVAEKRVVRVQQGFLMNRYFDLETSPRPEAKAADEATAAANPSRPAAEIFQNLRAASQSGWTMSSRWGIENNSLGGVNAFDILPVDLNCLMWHLELLISEGAALSGQAAKAQFFGLRAYDRRRNIREMFFEKSAGWFQDFNWRDKNLTGQMSLAGMFPLWFEMAEKPQVTAVASNLEKHFLRAGGLVSTLRRTGQDWDLPYGHAPLHWVSIEGLRKNGQLALAETVRRRWLATCLGVFKHSGQFLEKYNVEGMDSGGGFYAGQDGFGWTNGVFFRLLD